MKIYFVMNSINDAHANKRASDFKKQGHEVRQYGFLRHENIKYDNQAEVIGHFTNDISYVRRISIYIHGLQSLFNSHKNDNIIWYYQGIDVALFATFLNPKGKYIYEECDLAHTYIHYKWIQVLLERIDKRIIRKSQKTVVTSEGFIQYHYGSTDKCPQNVVLVPNKLSREICNFKIQEKDNVVLSRIRFAFVGGLRYPALLSIADIITKEYSCHEFHFYGFIDPTISPDKLPKRSNIFYHGAYKSPDDLPFIYSHIDILVSTYDTSSVNVRYAEPNKLYEAIYFGCPIVVSTGTFLAEKVHRLNIGYDVDPYSRDSITQLIRQINSDYSEKQSALSNINKDDAIDNNNYVNEILLF